MDMEERIERLESQNRRLRSWLVGVSVCLVSIFVLGLAAPGGQNPGEVLQCRGLCILSQDGGTAVFIHESNGCGALDLWDTTRKTSVPMVSLGVISRVQNGGGTQLYMKDARARGGINIVAVGESGNVWYTGQSGRKDMK